MKLVDILTEAYQTKDGDDIELKRFDDIEGDKNRGWRVDELKAYVNGEEVGYLKMAYIPRERMSRYYPTIFNWMQQVSGGAGLPYDKQDYHYKDLTDDERRKFLKSILHREKLVDYGGESIVDDMDDREVLSKIREVEEKIESRKGRQFREFQNYFKDKPYVDYINVDKEFQRQRIAEAMYLEGTKWMKEKGMKLYASGSQSDSAKAAWDHLSKKFKVKKSKSRKRRFLEPAA